MAEVAEHDDRLRLDRAADVDELGVVDELRERRYGIGDGDRRRTVQDHAHRTFLAVLADEDDAAPEVRVEQSPDRRRGVGREAIPSDHCDGREAPEPVGSSTWPRSREIHLAARPHGVPQPSDFALAEVDVPEPADGQVLIRNAFVSVDPYMRSRMNDVKSYVPPFALGEPLTGGAVGQVDRVAQRPVRGGHVGRP